MKNIYLFFALLLISISLKAKAQDIQTRPLCSLASTDFKLDYTALEQSIQTEMKEKRIPGSAVAVVCGDQVVYQKGFGVESVETQAPITANTLFRLASTTKMFVALATVNLAEKGKVNLKAPIGNYAKGLHPKLAALTLNQLLSHTAGLKDDAAQTGPLDETALAQRVLSWDETAFFTEPAQIMSYSNPGYVLVSYVLEQVENKPFADVMNEQVFQSLGMKRSTFRPMAAITYPFAQGHMSTPQGLQVVRPFAENAANWAPGSLFSNVEEVSRFLIAALNEGKLENEQKLSASAFKTIARPKVDVPALNRKYGYGIVSFKENGAQIIMHTGGRIGFGSIIWTVPEKRFGIVLLSNTTAFLSNSARKAMTLSVPVNQAASSEQPHAIDMSESEIASYAGIYRNNTTINAELVSQEKKLMLKLGTRLLPVAKIGENRFQTNEAGPLSEFVLIKGTDGKPEYLAAEYWALKRVH